MVAQEREQVAGRVGQRHRLARRPHRRDDRQQEVLDEVARVAADGDERAERDVASSPLVGQHPAGVPVEAPHLGEHPQVGGPGEVGRLREQAAEPAGARVLEAAARAPHAHRHVRLLRRHAQLAEQAQEIRVGAAVVHDEAGVDVDGAAVGRGQLVGVRVPAQPVVGLEQRDVVAALQEVGGREPGDAGADHGGLRTGHRADSISLSWALRPCGAGCAKAFAITGSRGSITGHAEHEAPYQRVPVAEAGEHEVARTRQVEPADRHPGRLGAQGVGVRRRGIRPAIPVAVGDQDGAPGELSDRVAPVQPGRQRAHRGDVGRPRGPERGASTHRVPEQHHRHARVAFRHCGDGPAGVDQCVTSGGVPPAHPVPQHVHGQAAAGEHPRERRHPAVGQPLALAIFLAVRLSAVQDEYDGGRPGGAANRPVRGGGGCQALDLISLGPVFCRSPGRGRRLRATSHHAERRGVTRRSCLDTG